jgi:hypothetical protein
VCALTKQCQNGRTRPSSSGLFFALSNSGQHRNTASVILTLALILAGFRLHALSGKDKKTKTEPSQRQCSQRQREERKIATTVLIQCGKEELTSEVPRHRTSHCFGSNLALGATFQQNFSASATDYEDCQSSQVNNNDSTNFLQLAIKPQRQAPSFIPSAAFNSHETATGTTTASSSFQ